MEIKILVLLLTLTAPAVHSQKGEDCPDNSTLITAVDSGSVIIDGPSSLTYTQMIGPDLVPLTGVHVALVNLSCPTTEDGVYVDTVSINVKDLGDVEICLLTDTIDLSEVADVRSGAVADILAAFLDVSEHMGTVAGEETRAVFGARKDNIMQVLVYMEADGAVDLMISDFSITYCCPTEGCLLEPCLNGATCWDDVDGYTCDCVDGYEGVNCEIDTDDCSPTNPCDNGGTCTDGVNEFSCECPEGFTGERCEDNIDDCTPDPCLNGGTCEDEVNDYYCECVPGYTGKDCQTDINDCDPDPCHNGATCTDLVNGHSCTCVTGYSGINCENDLDDCVSEPCQNGGTCVDGVNSYTCDCADGYTGPHCETGTCEPNPCQNGGVCTMDGDDFWCCCAPGYEGPTCEINTDDCAFCNNPCQNGGLCVDEVMTFSCACPPAFTGPFCELFDELYDPCPDGDPLLKTIDEPVICDAGAPCPATFSCVTDPMFPDAGGVCCFGPFP